MNTQGLWSWLSENLKWGVVIALAVLITLSIKEKRYGRFIGILALGAFAFAFLSYPREFLDMLSLPFKILFGVS
ncbi:MULTISPECIES: TcpD family membrane protein [unclassified Granulicatella]|uniref:TcpD family membrane protein n=1 Tax=unclassified Granulicatella TaxID=2630493 RepID=UPI00107447E2|nr:MULTISPECIES: TcpD family membrane protein [unclassified Granulicatella]MBF0780670.1 hypothetical protein [Granulicatella sp. 19428wC4_WM01]TFU94247.1 hypothetical protein E4T68_06130 [Granulicatella sp. WM01]